MVPYIIEVALEIHSMTWLITRPAQLRLPCPNGREIPKKASVSNAESPIFRRGLETLA
jgi:hypothetical protein